MRVLGQAQVTESPAWSPRFQPEFLPGCFRLEQSRVPAYEQDTGEGESVNIGAKRWLWGEACSLAWARLSFEDLRVLLLLFKQPHRGIVDQQ